MKLFSPPMLSDTKTSQALNYDRAMLYDEKEMIFTFNKEFVENYNKFLWEEKYKDQEQKNPWNNPQLEVIIETAVNFIEKISKVYAPRKFYGCDLWFLNELWKTNNYVGTRGYVTRSNDPQFQQITNPVAEERNKIHKTGIEWLKNFQKEIHYPYSLFVGDFWELQLQKLQSPLQGGFNQYQRLEAMHILNKLLSIAIRSLQNSPIYQKAAAIDGEFYHKLVPVKISREEAALSMKPKDEILISDTNLRYTYNM